MRFTILTAIVWLGGALARARAEGDVVLSEVCYQPAPGARGTELVELTNAGKEPADLSGWRLTKGVQFTFPPGTRLAPGACLLVCEDVAAFRVAHGDRAVVAGAFTGKLRDAGELLRLEDAAGKAVSDLHYRAVPPWPAGAAGGGLSLTRAHIDGDADDPSSWTAAPPSPGTVQIQATSPQAPSLYRVQHEPPAPRPGQPIQVSVRGHGHGHEHGLGAGAAPRLHYRIGSQENTVPMEHLAAAAGRDAAFTAEIPAQRAGILVRYWITAGAAPRLPGLPLPLRAPHADDPRDAFAVYVEEPRADGSLPRYTLVIDPQRFRALEQNPYSNELVPVVLVHQGKVFDASIRPRGAWARSWPKKSWKVVFPADRPFRGQRRINLSSGWRDEAWIREVLAYEIYRDCGVASPESRLVRVDLNGRFWGLAVEVEQPKRRLLRRHGLAGAALVKAASRANLGDERDLGSSDAYPQHYSLEAGGEPAFAELADFCAGLEDAADPAAFLEARLDLHAFVDYACATALAQNWDGFNKNHFFARDTRGTGKWRFLPWDLDRTLGDHWSWRFDVATAPLYLGMERFPGPTGWNRVFEKALAVPAIRERYHRRLRELLRDVFTEERLGARIEALRAAAGSDVDLESARWRGGEDWRDALGRLHRFIAERRAFLLTELPGGEPGRPRGLEPFAGAAVASFPLALRSSPHEPVDSGAPHGSTRWQVREASGSYEAPVIDRTSSDEILELRLEMGLLRPRTEHRWRLAHVAAGGKTSPWSEERSFVTGAFAFTPVPIDVRRHVNADVVANPGQPSAAAIDDRGGSLLEDGFDGRRSGNPLAQGLPRDRRLGVHELGDYSRPNAIQLTSETTASPRIAVPPGRYSCLRLVVTGGGGDTTLPVRLNYADGTAGRATIPCDDWYDDNPPDGPLLSVRNGAVPILNNLDRLRAGAFKDRNEPAIFEVTVMVDAARTLRSVVLLASEATYDQPGRTRCNILAVTGIRGE